MCRAQTAIIAKGTSAFNLGCKKLSTVIQTLRSRDIFGRGKRQEAAIDEGECSPHLSHMLKTYRSVKNSEASQMAHGDLVGIDEA